MPVIFSQNKIVGIPGNYPLTAENLLRVGLALCTLLIIEKELQKPTLSIDEANFLTLSLGVGFMNAGGDVVLKGEGDLRVRCLKRGENWELVFEPLSELEVKKLESMLFGRHPIPKRVGEEIGEFRL